MIRVYCYNLATTITLMALSKMGAMTFSITTVGIMTLSIMVLFSTLSIIDTA
jgi:hypothetical protein